MQTQNVAHEAIELTKLWDKVAVIIGFKDSEIFTSVVPFDCDASPLRLKSLDEISAELFTLADLGGVPICLIAYKEYEPQQVIFTAKPCLDFTEHPWAKRAYESYLEDHVYSLAEYGAKVEEIKSGNVH